MFEVGKVGDAGEKVSVVRHTLRRLVALAQNVLPAD
jgi:hypothetical protein